MQFDIFTLFPEIFPSYFDSSILKRARQRGLLHVDVHNIRDWAVDRHHVTDDLPYGGGGGMIMKVEPVFSAVESILGTSPSCPVVMLTPQGRVFTQKVAEELVQYSHLALICGRYEGVDERIREHLVTDEISIGDFVLTGGELPALMLVDALTRLLPGVLGDEESAQQDSFMAGLLDHPHYTRPEQLSHQMVPEVLLGGDHEAIRKWRLKQSLGRTWLRRPDLLIMETLSDEQKALLEQFIAEFRQEVK